ncbi:hypothetical protein QA596_09280 [Balneolales bacterium ANBcel1]|nr:hypothetical protein [Balneolales bacterium ANBcel1]
MTAPCQCHAGPEYGTINGLRGLDAPLSLLVLLLVAIPLITVAGCGSSSDTDSNEGGPAAHIHGTITVDEALDPTRDFSGIRVYVLDYSRTAGPDTLYRAVTDRDGHFGATARSAESDIYALEIHRGTRRLADTTMVLARGDTVLIEGSLPRFSGFAEISSQEHEALHIVNRLDRQFNRMMALASAGAVPADTIPHLIDTWSDLFWNAWRDLPESVAGKLAARESLRLLQQQDDGKLIRRLQEAGDVREIRIVASQIGFPAQLRQNGLDYALAWADSLEQRSGDRDISRRLAMHRIEVLYDSSRTDLARQHLRRFEENFGDDEEVARWLEVLKYDIEHLYAGALLPDFELGFADVAGTGMAIPYTRDDLQGSPAMIEVVRLADREYQSNYPALQTIFGLFQNRGIRFLTIPVEGSPIAVNAFYNERGQDWPVASAGAFAESDLEERWNIYEMPVRFLIDSEGRIVRKLHGHNLNELIIKIDTLLTNGEVL